MLRLAGLSVCLISLAAVAQPQDDEGLKVTKDRVEARYGIRWESDPQWVESLPLTYERPYRVRRANGVEFRLWLHAPGVQAKPAEIGGRFRGPGRYALTQISGRTFQVTQSEVPNLVQAAGIDPSVPELILRDDGTYAMGSVTGRWRHLEGRLVLDGRYSFWGVGEPSSDGNSVVFRVGGNPHAAMVLTRAETL